MNTISKFAVALLALALGACRGGTSTTPPIHIVLDMDFQPKLKTQSETRFEGWKDGRSMRLPVKGTVAQGSLPNLTLLPDPKSPGKGTDGQWLAKNPLALTAETLARGKDRYEINCAICHGQSGRGGNGPEGHGLVGRRWPVAVPNFHVVQGKDNRVANFTDGEFFEVMSSPVGRNTMPSYAARVSVEDRWAIVQYIRALQTLGNQ